MENYRLWLIGTIAGGMASSRYWDKHICTGEDSEEMRKQFADAAIKMADTLIDEMAKTIEKTQT